MHSNSYLPRHAFCALFLTFAATGSADDLVVRDPLSAIPGQAAALPISVNAATAITGLQFEIVCAENQATGGFISVASPTTDHLGDSRQIGIGRTRCLVFSPTNQALDANTSFVLPLILSPTGPVGGPDIAVENIRFISSTGAAVSATPTYGAITQWKKTNFTPAALAAGITIGDQADPDGDGVANLFEYATGQNPLTANPTGPVASFGKDGPRFTITYRQARQASGVTLAPEVSPNLLIWNPAPTPVPTGVSDATSIQMAASITITGTSQFLRLNVTRSPQP